MSEIRCISPRETASSTYLYAYRANRYVDGAVSLGLFYVLKHLECPNAYARILSVDYSSAFNTIIPSKLFEKIQKVGVP